VRDWEVAEAEAEAEVVAVVEAFSWLDEDALISETALKPDTKV